MTTIEQSKKLLELGLSPKSADMSWYRPNVMYPYELHTKYKGHGVMADGSDDLIPAWSVSALIMLMPATIQTKESVEPYSLMIFRRPPVGEQKDWFEIEYGYRYAMTVGYLNEWYHIVAGEDLTTVCFDMVCWLLEHDYINGGD